MTLSANTMLQNRYAIVRMIAQGGMSTVYEAIDHRLNCTVALKHFTVGDDAPEKQLDSLRASFEREAFLLANLRHPALAAVSDHFAEGNEQYLVMQYIPGDDLATMLERNGGSLPFTEVMRWADWLLDALDYLHSQDPPIIHLDIKPQNLKLTPRGEVILLDLGMARRAVTQTKHLSDVLPSIRGYTTQYAPLEQMQGVHTDVRSDLYALAATLYHC
ncbi:MAG: serine/threonine protein kinase [Chloroflexaceae bacterium]|nr:serine/threonine protein kinase [Chloroflexaceae bacterium]